MNRFKRLSLAALFCSVTLFATHNDRNNDCFRKYQVTLSNQSGGIADIKSSKGIQGICRKTELENNSAIRIRIQKRGAEILIKAGPEGNKTTRKIKFYSKNYRNFNPSVTLNEKGFNAEGFSQKEVSFSASIENRSGGIAQIIDTCDASGKSMSIPDGKSARVMVKPSSYIVVTYGPERQKLQTKIVFVEQTGDQPQVTLAKRGFFSSGIQNRDLDIQAQRIPVIRYRKRHATKARFLNNMKNKKTKKAVTQSKSRSRRSRRRRR